MNWSGPEDIAVKLQRLWDRGVILRSCLETDEPLFPARIVLRKPSTTDLINNFQLVRDWIAELQNAQHNYRIEWKVVRHRVIGENKIPVAVLVDSLEECAAILNKCDEVVHFNELVRVTEARQPKLMEWLRCKPLKALAAGSDWNLLLDCVQWLERHPKPGIYLRQVTIPGIHTKFFEEHRKLLAELFDVCLEAKNINTDYKGVAGFCRRYGFHDKPMRIRFRLLDPDLIVSGCGEARDITLTNSDFCSLNLRPEKIFVTENEINFLSFPAVAGAIIIFGGGYGFDELADAALLDEGELYYWGDIDTHGFAILDQFRSYFPHTQSLLMDEKTLLGHQQFWTIEQKQADRSLEKLNRAEKTLYNDLLSGRFGEKVRLEQEFISFRALKERLKGIFV